MESQLPQFLLISPRFDLRNGMIAKDDSYHLVTQIIDIRGFFYYNTLVNFSPLVLNVVWCYAKKIDCIFNILSISFYLDQNKFWYISGCLALSKNNFSNFYMHPYSLNFFKSKTNYGMIPGKFMPMDGFTQK